MVSKDVCALARRAGGDAKRKGAVKVGVANALKHVGDRVGGAARQVAQLVERVAEPATLADLLDGDGAKVELKRLGHVAPRRLLAEQARLERAVDLVDLVDAVKVMARSQRQANSWRANPLSRG